jgi:hypothetical protein
VKPVFFAVFAVLSPIVFTGCGKSGPPLPPLVRVPAAPANIVADRRGDTVDIEFSVPSANTDGSRPANVERVDVYAITGPASIPDDQILKHGTKVASIEVKAPRDPDKTVDPEESSDEMELPEGKGLNQGAVARVSEELSPAAMTPYDPATEPDGRGKKPDTVGDVARPLVGPATVPSRTYVGVGITTRGRKGTVSKRVTVPLVPPPPPPGKPTVSYNETAVTVTWPPVTLAGMVQDANTDGLLESRPIGPPPPTLSYNVYEVAPLDASAAAIPTKLTKAPVDDTKFEDKRITWGERRCYAVHSVATTDGLSIESPAADPECATFKDTFPPVAPKGLQALGGESLISLIWEPSPEKDLVGYLVLRGKTPDALVQITPEPIPESRFSDGVQSGLRYFYAVKAVDKGGNVSPASAPADETARE